MDKISSPYKKLKEIIIGKYKGRMYHRDFDKNGLLN